METAPADPSSGRHHADWLLLRHAATAGSIGCFVGRSDRTVAAVDPGALEAIVTSLMEIDVAVVTPLRRTSDTLDMLVRAGLRAPSRVIVAPGLVEQSFGRWEERGYDELAKADPAYWPFWDDPVHHVPPGGESYLALWQRSIEAYRTLSATHLGRVLHVGHAGPIRALLGHAAGQDPSAALTQAVPPLSLHRMQMA